MKGAEKLRRALLRWDHVLMVVLPGLPFAALMLLGFLWLVEHGAVLWFFVVSLALAAVLFLMRLALHRRSRKVAQADPGAEELSVEPDPAWLPREKQVFSDVCRYIAEVTAPARPWEDLPQEALDVVNRVAAGLDGRNRGALHFTLPEALLLLETTAARYRGHLRSKLPFSDQVSLATLYWLWRHRNHASLVWKVAHGSGRLTRFVLNPAAGILRELQQIVSGGNSRYLTGSMMGVMQAVLLEEVAYAAIELYSGRLRFSDEELLQIPLASARADEKRQALPDLPLRILFVGQTSAGKSTLINALLEAHRAETDAAATTASLVAYRAQLDGIACLFLDSEGLDGSSRQQERMLRQMTQADMIVWVIRAGRPARDVDRSLKERFAAWFEEHPRRRRPTVVAVATGVDQLVRDWPQGGEPLPDSAHGTIAAAMQAIAGDLDGLQPLPVCTGPRPWNLDAVRDALCSALPETQLVQRNRRRVEGARRENRLRSQVRRGAHGVKQGVKTVGSRVLGSSRRFPEDSKAGRDPAE